MRICHTNIFESLPPTTKAPDRRLPPNEAREVLRELLAVGAPPMVERCRTFSEKYISWFICPSNYSYLCTINHDEIGVMFTN